MEVLGFQPRAVASTRCMAFSVGLWVLASICWSRAAEDEDRIPGFQQEVSPIPIWPVTRPWGLRLGQGEGEALEGSWRMQGAGSGHLGKRSPPAGGKRSRPGERFHSTRVYSASSTQLRSLSPSKCAPSFHASLRRWLKQKAFTRAREL